MVGLEWASKNVALLGTIAASLVVFLGGVVQVRRSMAAVITEFRPNGGSSIKDQLNRIEKLALHSSTMSRAHIIAAHLPVWQSDSAGDCLWISPELERIMGVTARQAIGMGWLSAIREPDRDRVRREYLSAVTECRDFHQIYAYENLATGLVTYVIGRAIPVQDVGGQVIGFVGWAETPHNRRRDDTEPSDLNPPADGHFASRRNA